MNNNTNGNFDKAYMLKDIKDREKIINDYRKIGYLDREKAITMIQSLRVNDKEVAQVTTVKLATGAIPFQQATNEDIIAELQMQIDILSAKLLL